ncbi:hypothetical protein D9M72_469200 [compost metagenome]
MTWARGRSLGLFRSVLSINSWQAYTRPKPQTFPGRPWTVPQHAVSRLMDADAGGPQTDLMDDTEKRETIAKVTDRLSERYPETSRYYIAGLVAEEYARLDTSRIRTYIPTLIEHGAKNRLRGNANRPPAEH